MLNKNLGELLNEPIIEKIQDTANLASSSLGNHIPLLL